MEYFGAYIRLQIHGGGSGGTDTTQEMLNKWYGIAREIVLEFRTEAIRGEITTIPEYILERVSHGRFGPHHCFASMKPVREAYYSDVDLQTYQF